MGFLEDDENAGLKIIIAIWIICFILLITITYFMYN